MKYSTRLLFASLAELLVVTAVASSRILGLLDAGVGVDWLWVCRIKAIIANDKSVTAM
jgi:hypothetical protein